MSERIGFTGTQHGLTDPQHKTLVKLVQAYMTVNTVEWAIHGDCIGADEQFHYIVTGLGIPTHSRPCNLRDKRAFCPATIIEPEAPPLERNQLIVNDSSILFAGPNEFAEQKRSGTWATIRRARIRGIPICIVWPDGRSTLEPRRGDELF